MSAIKALLVITLLTAVSSFCEVNVQLLRARSKPLSTAGFLTSFGPGSTGVIPRLEPGLRYVQSRISFLSKPQDNVRVRLFNLNKLSQYEPQKLQHNGIGRLFGEASLSFKKITSSLFHYVKKIVAALILFTSSSILPMKPMPSIAHPTALHTTVAKKAGVSIASIVAAGVAAGATMKPAQASTFNWDVLKLKQYKRLTPAQRLATTPLYYVANSRGNSYLQNDAQAGRPDQKIVTYFMSSEDAADFLNEMTQVNGAGGGGSAEFRLMTVSMEKVVNQIQARKQSRKLGRYEMDTIYRIQPSSRQIENAQKLTSKAYGNNLIKATQALKGVNIPMFTAQGLTITRANGEVITPYYFAYEDLVQDWAKLRASAAAATSATTSATTDSAPTGTAGLKNSLKSKLNNAIKTTTGTGTATTIPAEPKVTVYEFADVMVLANGITAETLASLSTATPDTFDTLSTVKNAILKGRGVAGAGTSTSTSTGTGTGTADASKTGAKAKASGKSTIVKGKAATLAPVQAPAPPQKQKQGSAKEELVGFMPPRREIEMIKRYYRNQAGFKNEFSKSKYLG